MGSVFIIECNTADIKCRHYKVGQITKIIGKTDALLLLLMS